MKGGGILLPKSKKQAQSLNVSWNKMVKVEIIILASFNDFMYHIEIVNDDWDQDALDAVLIMQFMGGPKMPRIQSSNDLLISCEDVYGLPFCCRRSGWMALLCGLL